MTNSIKIPSRGVEVCSRHQTMLDSSIDGLQSDHIIGQVETIAQPIAVTELSGEQGSLKQQRYL